jgi:nuclear pore complex protein Nup205
MADELSLDAARALHQDLLAVSESRLAAVEGLFLELESRIADFKRLLDKNPKNEQSRQKLASGMFLFH